MPDLKKYDTYKDSGVPWIEEIPEHWDIIRQKFLANLNPNYSLSHFLPKTKVVFVPMENIRTDYIVEEYREVGEYNSSYTIFRNGDILLAKVTPCFENGNTAIVNFPNTLVGYGSSELFAIQSKNIVIRYLHFFLQSNGFKNKAVSMMQGAGGLKRIPTTFLNNSPTPSPPLPEQQTIANYLDKKTAVIDRTIKKQEELIILLKEKRQSLITHVATKGLDPTVPMKDSGVSWIGEIPEHWTITRLKYLAQVKTGTTPPGASEEYFSSEGPPWYTPGDFNSGIYLKRAERRLSDQGKTIGVIFPQNAVLIVGIGATVAKVGISKQESSSNQQINGIVCNNNANYIFVGYYLHSKQDVIRNLAQATTLPIFNQTDTKDLSIPLLPIPEQQAIANYLDNKTQQIDTTIEKVKSNIKKLKEYRQSLITEAVTGKFKVPTLAEAEEEVL